MKLEIAQDRRDPLEGCRVSSQGRLLFTSERSIRRSLRQETVLRSSAGDEVLRIDPNFYLTRPAYDVIMEGKRLPFRTESWLRSVYVLSAGATLYTVFAHRSLTPRYSVFVAGVQVAAILRKPFSVLESDKFTVLYEEPAAAALLVAIALILDRIGGSTNYALATYHGPAAWLEARRFDESFLGRFPEQSAV